ncbi:SHOCT domain-containing protein [Enterococcus sp. HY326]|uniref:SHOCT domain-containing protein n=1 Tax=Enterococcus sp. HY326 TaxID=2971265 RepID=UPI0022408C53|nr:SHOCT domain-containing protein [Enterococcus sp. HY326]
MKKESSTARTLGYIAWGLQWIAFVGLIMVMNQLDNMTYFSRYEYGFSTGETAFDGQYAALAFVILFTMGILILGQIINIIFIRKIGKSKPASIYFIIYGILCFISLAGILFIIAGYLGLKEYDKNSTITATSSTDSFEKIENLYKQGILDAEEYKEAKQKLIDKL